MSNAFRAMELAMELHKDQKRKYTNEPYFGHLAEVAGIVAAAGIRAPTWGLGVDLAVSVAWLHDAHEDQAADLIMIHEHFGPFVTDGVRMLSDMEEGSRAERKAASRERLASAEGWVQSIKCADLISNTKSIVQHDPKFAVTYLEEKRLLLWVMTKADPRLREMAMRQCHV